jgi:hydrogenase-4 component B
VHESAPVVAAALACAFGAFGAGALAAIVWPSGSSARRVSLGFSMIGCGALLAACTPILTHGSSWAWRTEAVLQPLGGLSLRVDPLSAFFLLLIGATGIPAALFAVDYLRGLDEFPRGRALHALFAVFLGGMCLVTAADNVITFLFAWEVMALSSLLLVASDRQQEDAGAAGVWYAVMTHAGFVVLLAAFLVLAQGGSWEFEAIRARASSLPVGTATVVFVLAAVAFGSKAGLVPLHVWLPRAHPAAPSHVSALMSAAMVKLGVYGAIRVLFDLMPVARPWWGGALLVIGVLTALTGVLYSVTESHLKRVLAYSTVENVGLIFVGLGFALLMRGYGYAELAAMGLVVALLHTLNHAVFKSMLFLGAGAVVHGTGTASMEAYGGLVTRMPQTAALCLVGVLALAALPPLNGFPSEWLTFQLLVAGARHTAPGLAISLPLALAGIALTAGLAAVAAVRLFGITFLALPRTEAARRAHEAPPLMRAAMALPAVACLALGLFPTVALAPLVGVALDLGLPMARVDAGLALALPLVGSRLWPVALAAMIAVTALLAAALVSRVWRSGRVRTDVVWNCGRVTQSARSEYTAAAFAEPLRRVFTGFYRPTQEVTVEAHPTAPYFVRTMTLRSDLAPWIEQVFYSPVIRAATWSTTRANRLLTGSIHLYLAFLAATLVALLVLARVIT